MLTDSQSPALTWSRHLRCNSYNDESESGRNESHHESESELKKVKVEYRKNYLSFVFSPVVGASPSTTSPPSFLSEERSYWSSTSTFKHQDEKTEGTHLRYGFCDVIEENKLTRNDEKDTQSWWWSKWWRWWRWQLLLLCRGDDDDDGYDDEMMAMMIMY